MNGSSTAKSPPAVTSGLKARGYNAELLVPEAEKNFPGRKIRKDTSDGDPDWEENFYLLQKTSCCAVLTESFFYDNTDDLRYLESSEGKAAIVRTHIDGIISYLNRISPASPNNK